MLELFEQLNFTTYFVGPTSFILVISADIGYFIHNLLNDRCVVRGDVDEVKLPLL